MNSNNYKSNKYAFLWEHVDRINYIGGGKGYSMRNMPNGKWWEGFTNVRHSMTKEWKNSRMIVVSSVTVIQMYGGNW